MKAKTTTTTKKRPAKTIKQPKNKPIMIQSEVSSKEKPTITIIVGGGFIEDVVKERCNEVNVIVHDYDVSGIDETELCVDKNGKQYKLIKF